MKVKGDINDLFRTRLGQTEMNVRDGFWEKLQCDLPKTTAGASFITDGDAADSAPTMKGRSGSVKRKYFDLTPRSYRLVAAASVIMVLGIASAAFWCFSPKEDIKEAFTKVAVLTPEGTLKGDAVQETFPSIHKADPTQPGHRMGQSGGNSVAMLNADDNSSSVSVTVSITVTQRVFGHSQQSGQRYYGNSNSARQTGSYATNAQSTNADQDTSPVTSSQEAKDKRYGKPGENREWALKASIGSSLPKKGYDMPLTAGVSLERQLSKRLSLEAGVQYNRLHSDRTLHVLGIPVKLNMSLASSPKVNLYGLIGGAIEKCIAGAEDNSFEAEPLQLSVMAGLGVRYQVNNCLALFAEPSVSHHFDTNSATRTLRTERPTNLNLLCGVRMTY